MPSPTTAPAAKPTRGTVGIESGETVPAQALEQLLQLLNDAGAKSEQVKDAADLRLNAQSSDGAKLAWERIFVPVDRMSSVLGSITLRELRDVWTGASTSPNFATIYPDESIVPDLDVLLGPHGSTVKPQPKPALADAVWGDPMGLGILPFEDLTPRLRAIPVDDNSPTDNRFRAAEWPLATRAYLSPLTERGQAAMGRLGTPLPITNRDPNKLTVLVMTGVTAMARNSAVAIDRSGDNGFLARQVGPELAAADITTTSNEISDLRRLRGRQHPEQRPALLQTCVLGKPGTLGHRRDRAHRQSHERLRLRQLSLDTASSTLTKRCRPTVGAWMIRPRASR